MNNNEPLVSVIVPVYNVEKYVSKCIETILEQTYKNFELILVDDGSPDKSGEICERYAATDNRIKVIHRENGGLSAARNSGLNIAQGDYILFVDSDDFINIHTLEITVASCIKNDCDICIFSFLETEDHNYAHDTPVSDDCKVYESDHLFENYFQYPFICTICSCWNKLYKAHIFKTLRFPEDVAKCEDAAIRFHILFQAKKICVLDEHLYYYYLSPNSIMRSPFKESSLDILKATQMNMDFLEDKKYPHITNSIRARYEYDVSNLYAQLCLSDLKNKKELKPPLKALRKKLHKQNKNNPHFPEGLRLFSILIYHCPPVYRLKRLIVNVNNLIN